MRRAAVLVALAAIVAGMAVPASGYLTRGRDYVAVTPQPPTIAQPTYIALPAHGRACMNLVALDRHSEQARFQVPTSGGGAVPLEFTLTGPGYRTQARVPPRYAGRGTVAVTVRPPPRSLVATACVRNLGDRVVDLAGVNDRYRSRSGVLVDGTPSAAAFVLTFYERRPVSILSRLPLSLQRMDVFRPGVIAPATLWLLLALFVLGVPAVVVWAFARALGADEEAEAKQPV